jgi:hypothetical protein
LDGLQHVKHVHPAARVGMDRPNLTYDQEGQFLQNLALAEQVLIRTHTNQIARIVQPAKLVVTALAHDRQ